MCVLLGQGRQNGHGELCAQRDADPTLCTGVADGVNACAADQGVVACAPFEGVVARIACERVVEGTADQGFDRLQTIGSGPARRHAGEQTDGDACGGRGVRGRVKTSTAGQGIVAQTADQGVVAVAALQVIAGHTARNFVVQGIAHATEAHQCRCAGVDQVFHLGVKYVVGQTGLDRVGALGRELHDAVNPFVSHHIGVVALAARQHVEALSV